MDRSGSDLLVAHVSPDEAARDAVGDELSRLGDGIQVVGAATPAAVQDRLGAFDCVVSAYSTDGVDGVSFLRSVRAREPELPFVLYTDQGSESLASEAIAAGVSRYVPADQTEPEELAAAVLSAAEDQSAAAAGRGTEQLLTELVSNTNVVLWVFDADWSDVLFVNDAYEDVYGRTTAELRECPRSFLEAIHPGDREAVEVNMVAMERGESIEIEHRVNAAENYERWVWVHAEPIVEDGEVVRHVGFTRDVTERKHRERELRRQERRFQAIFDDPNILVGLLEPDGTVLDVNQTAMAYVEASVDDVRGERFWDTPWWGDESTRSDVRQWVLRAAGGEYVEFEASLSRPSGAPYSLEGVFRPVTTADGEVEAIVVSDRDVTERIRREELIEVLNRVLRHNLRNDMNTIHGYAEQLEAQLPDTGAASDHVETIRERALALIDLSETASELERSLRRTAAPGHRRLGDVVDGAVSTVRSRHPDAEVRREIAHRLDVRVSETLQEAVAELLDNGVKHSGERTASIEVSSGSHGRAAIEVSDGGPGLPDQERRVLETGRETQLQHGSGLGLWLVYWVVTGCGGTVSVPEHEDGTTVRIEVPVHE